MSRVALDTSAYSAFMRGHPGVIEALREADEIYLSPVVLGELLVGFMRGRNKRRNEQELRTFLSAPRVNLVDVNEDTAERYAVILDSLWEAGVPIPTNDIWIAASAMQHGLCLVTTDSHYQKITQIIVDYFGVS